jgi:hypothetical protein
MELHQHVTTARPDGFSAVVPGDKAKISISRQKLLQDPIPDGADGET